MSDVPPVRVVQLLTVDPLAEVVPFLPPADGVGPARCEDGGDLHTGWVDLSHVAVQGQTRSGKSAWCHSLLARAVRHRPRPTCR
jgi:hypothetical protein